MIRERALKVVLVLVGLFFLASFYFLTISLWHAKWHSEQSETEPMFMSVYFTLGIFVLLAARNPSSNCSMVEPCSRRCYAVHGIPDSKRTRRIIGRGGFVWGHWCAPDRAGSGKAVNRADIRRRCVGPHLRAAVYTRYGPPFVR